MVGAITPWNFPLFQIALKVAPALAAGCTVVLKPSEVAPINAFILADIIHEAGLPKGVFNLVTGLGPVVGEAIATHPLVDKVSFTGSTRAGKRVMELCAQSVKRVSLEMGGKSANIILEDADFAAAVPAGVFGCYMNSGPDLLGAHADDRAPLEVGRGRAARRRGRGRLRARQPVRADDRPRAARFGGAARQGSRLHQQGHRRRRDARDGRRRRARRSRHRLLRPADRLLERVERHDDRAGRDLRSGALDHPVRHRAGGDRRSPTTPNTASPAASGPAPRNTRSRSRRSSAPARSTSTAAPSTRTAPFGGYKSSGIGRERGAFGFEDFLEMKSIQR